MAQREFAISTIKSFVKDCERTGLHFDKVLLFGSYSREQANEWSDIDVLLISSQFSRNTMQNLKLYSKVNIKYPLIETHPYPTDYFIAGDPFLKEITKTAIEIA